MYHRAMDTARKYLAFRPMVPDINTSLPILFTGDVSVNENNKPLTPNSQHLSCFVGGMFGLAGKLLQLPDHVSVGEQLTRGCVWAYAGTPTGIMPEIFTLIPCPSLDVCLWDETRWQRDGDKRLAKGYASVQDSRYILRPEAIESVFLTYRITGDERWRDDAWTMFQRIIAATETEFGNSAIDDVAVEGETKKEDEMESFGMAETLKYFYLIFSPPDLISLDAYVFNTEAHPLKIPRHVGKRDANEGKS